MERLDNLLGILMDYEEVAVAPAYWESGDKMVYVVKDDAILFGYDLITGEMEVLEPDLSRAELAISNSIMDDIAQTFGDELVEESKPENIVKLSDYRE